MVRARTMDRHADYSDRATVVGFGARFTDELAAGRASGVLSGLDRP
jgi:hypothetical protein